MSQTNTSASATSRTRVSLALVALIAIALPSAVAVSGDGSNFEPRVPSGRYEMAGGCYAVGSNTAGFVGLAGDVVASADREDAEPFHFQATDLGEYLLFSSEARFLAATEGLAGTAADAVTGSTPGAIVGGVALEQTDAVGDEVGSGPAGEATGRGADVILAGLPSELADWRVIEVEDGLAFMLPSTRQMLIATRAGDLALARFDRNDPRAAFTLDPADGCAAFPEIEVNVEGDPHTGATPYAETSGFLDAHLHMMAFEFLGGRARCGRPWHRYGVTYALIDCPDHEPGGEGAVLEQFLSGIGQHDTDGWPTFTGWPRYNSLTHEQIYYKWLERAWRGGLRMFTNLLVDNNQLCKIYPYKRNSCNEMDSVRLQAKRINELERYIDAQNGGPGKGWFRIVTDPFEARRVINEGKLAVVLGIEVSVPLDCRLLLDFAQCDADEIDERLDAVYDLGVRQMELVNKFDNALAGVAGDNGATGVAVNAGNKGDTGHFWRMETCDPDEPTDRTQYNWHDESGAPDQFSGRDSLVGAILRLFGVSGAVPIYPEGPHCNVIGLSDLGEHMIRGMVERGMIFDPDHMGARARSQAMDLIEELGYSGVVSSHGWADDTTYPRVLEVGGVVTPYAGGSTSFASKWDQHKAWADDRYLFGFGYGADTNGFGSQGGPRADAATNPVTYPFTGLGGVTIDAQVSGTRTYDLNTDGVAHYGLYPDWIEDLRLLRGQAIIDDMARGPEAYLQMWERAIGITPNACRPDVDDLTDADIAQLTTGMRPEAVIRTVGQPDARVGATFEFCVTGGRTATATFDASGLLEGVTTA